MNGSEKQIKWAQDIQQTVRGEIDDFYRGPGADSEQSIRNRTVYHERFELLVEAQVEARWWIDNRTIELNWRKYLRTRSERTGNGPQFPEGNWTVTDAYEVAK